MDKEIARINFLHLQSQKSEKLPHASSSKKKKKKMPKDKNKFLQYVFSIFPFKFGKSFTIYIYMGV